MSELRVLPARLDVQGAPGDVVTAVVSVVEDGSPVDISGWTLSGTNVTAAITDGAAGEFTLTFPTDTEGAQAWKVARTDPAARTLIAGTLSVSARTSGPSETEWTLELEDGGPVELEVTGGGVVAGGTGGVGVDGGKFGSAFIAGVDGGSF